MILGGLIVLLITGYMVFGYRGAVKHNVATHQNLTIQEQFNMRKFMKMAVPFGLIYGLGSIARGIYF